MSAHTPGRRRPSWPEMPEVLRSAVEERLGDRVVGWTSQDSGYSDGLASVLTTARGDRVFVKAAASSNEFTQHLYREEARRVVLLPDGVPMPRFRWAATVGDGASWDDGGSWEVLAFDAAVGRPPRTPWRADELSAVVRLAHRIAEHEVPAGVLPDAVDELPDGRWAELADGALNLDAYDPWFAQNLERLALLAADAPEAMRGRSVVHGDLRGDNALVTATPGGVTAVAVDWAYVSRGNVVSDVVGMLPAVRLEGGPEPEDVLAAHPLPPGTDPQAVDAWLALLAGYFVSSSLQPAPPGIPHLRAFQRAQGEVCIGWLRQRLRW